MSAAMFTTLLLMAATEPQPVTQEEFRAQAARCGVSLEYRRGVEEGYDAWISADGKELYIRDNRPKKSVDCLNDWGTERGLLVVFHRT